MKKQFSHGNSTFYIVVIILFLIAAGMGAAIYFHQRTSNGVSVTDGTSAEDLQSDFKDLASDDEIATMVKNLQDKILSLEDAIKLADAAANDTPGALTSPKNSTLKSQAQAEISRQVDGFGKLADVIANLKSLTSDQKTAITSQIQADITELNNLGTAIETDSSITATRVDVQTLLSKYKVYAVFMPKVYTLAALENANDVVSSLNQLAAKFSARIAQLESSGQDATNLTKALIEMQTNLEGAQDKLKIANDLLTGLVPENYPANKGVIQSVQQSMADAKKSIDTVQTDAQNISTLLKNSKVSASSSVSALPLGN